jgi:diguanylate cyclase (GGDEF)-like protein
MDGNIEHYIGSFVDISERKAAEEKINHLAHFDTLTDLPNRANLQGRLEQALALARRDGHRRHVAVMFLDLDRFKNINDTLGHHIGDALLLEVSRRLRSSVRESDVVARLGGDEFVVVLTGADAVAAERIAGKMLQSLTQPYHIDGQCLHTTSSIGIAVFPGDGETVDLLMRNADAAMYQAKAAGRNNVKFFAASMNQAARDRRQLEEDLHLALQKKQFVLHYQPQVDTQRRIFGTEVLLRWQHPEHGLVPPGRFIPLAEDTGLIVPIGKWVLETACDQLKAWSVDARTRDLQVAVNVSARQFRQADFIEQLHELLEHSGADPTRLKLELTESLVLDNVTDTIAKMNAIKLLGVTFSMDDFGTGYSSLSYLTRLPLDQLKIDRAFVSRLPDNQSDAVIAQTIVTMGRSLGLTVIAEGVESEAQRQFLDGHGCHGYQGFLFGRPLPVEAFEQLLPSGADGELPEDQPDRPDDSRSFLIGVGSAAAETSASGNHSHRVSPAARPKTSTSQRKTVMVRRKWVNTCRIGGSVALPRIRQPWRPAKASADSPTPAGKLSRPPQMPLGGRRSSSTRRPSVSNRTLLARSRRAFLTTRWGSSALPTVPTGDADQLQRTGITGRPVP